MSLWLTDDELMELTGYKSQRKQKFALAELKIPFRSRPADGFPLVERSRFDSHTVLTPREKRRESRLDFLRE